MTKPGYTHVLAIIDRSGSMWKIRTDTEGGFNSYVKDQASQPGECRFTVVQFDDVYEVVHADLPAAEVPAFTLAPRGWTALYDAIGRGCNELGQTLAAKPEEERPERVVVLIMTDGKENRSREFKDPAVLGALIKQQTEQWQWTFTYLGANQDAILEAGKIGIAQDQALTYAATPDSASAVFAVASASTTSFRGGGGYSYSPEQRERAMGTQGSDAWKGDIAGI